MVKYWMRKEEKLSITIIKFRRKSQILNLLPRQSLMDLEKNNYIFSRFLLNKMMLR